MADSFTIRRVNPFTGELRERELPISKEEFKTVLKILITGTLSCYKNLTDEDLCFIITGATEEEFEKYKTEPFPF